MPEIKGVTEGRIVHYVFAIGGKLVHRPAIIVNAYDGASPEGRVNVQIFKDGQGDQIFSMGIDTPLAAYRSNVCYSAEPMTNTWHWPELA